MLTPSIQLLLYSSCVFLMGLLLGWVLWKLSNASSKGGEDPEVTFWQERFEQVQNERNFAQDRIAALETERDALKAKHKATA